MTALHGKFNTSNSAGKSSSRNWVQTLGLFAIQGLLITAVLLLVALIPAPAIAGMRCDWMQRNPSVGVPGTTSHEAPVWVQVCESTYEPRGGGWTREPGGGRDGDGSEHSGNRGDSNENNDQAAKPPCEQESANPMPTAGNPVVIATGNKIESETDFGTGGEMALHLSRQWNQLWDGNGIFGWHWISSFDYRLSFGSKSSFSACYARPGIVGCSDTTGYADIWAHRPDGRMIHFVRNATDGVYYENKPSPVSKIVRQADGTLQLTFENNMTERYTKGGYPLWIQDEHGVRWTYTYGGLNGTQVQRVTHSNGRFVEFVWIYDELREVRDPAGTPYKFTYTAQKYDSSLNKLIGLHILRTAELPGTPATTITYHLTGESGEPASQGSYALSGKSFNGMRYSRFAYSGKRASSTEHANGVDRYTFGYTVGTGGAMTVVVTNPLGKQATYDFLNNRLLAVTGHPSTNCPLTGSNYAYDANGNLDRYTDNNGNVTDYDYNGAGQLTKKVEAPGKPESRITTYVWDSPINRIKEETIQGHSKTSYTYAADGRIGSVTVFNLSPNGVLNQSHTVTYSYVKHPNGLLATAVVDGTLPGSGDAITWNYDALGNLTAVRNSLGHATTYSNYNTLGLPGRITGPNGDITEYVYDARGRITTVKQWVNGAWQATTYTYDSAGYVIQVQRPDGQARQFEYDAAWRLVREYEQESPGVYAQKRYAYNNLSQVTRIDTERSAAPVMGPALSAPSTDADGAYIVSWSALSDAVSYRLEERVNSGAWAQIADTAATSRTLSGKANGTYSYRVKACNVAGCGPLSNTGTTTVSLSGPPATPSLTAPQAENFTGTFQIAWGAVSGAASYRVEESANGAAWAQIFDTTATSVSRTRPSGEYSYRARACNAAGCSTYSAVRTVYVDKGDSCPGGCLMEAPAPEVQSTASDSDGGEA